METMTTQRLNIDAVNCRTFSHHQAALTTLVSHTVAFLLAHFCFEKRACYKAQNRFPFFIAEYSGACVCVRAFH